MADSRIIELETRLAFQEQAIQELSDVCVRLEREIDRLTLRLHTAEDRLRALQPSEVVDPAQESPPPHY